MTAYLDTLDREADVVSAGFRRERLARNLRSLADKLTAGERADLADYDGQSNRRLATLFEKVFGRKPVRDDPLLGTFRLLSRFLAMGKVPQ